MYDHVITKFSRMVRLLHFLIHGAPLARFARESSAIRGISAGKLDSFRLDFVSVSDELGSIINDYLK